MPVAHRTGLEGVYLFRFDFDMFGRLGDDGKPLEPLGPDFFEDQILAWEEALAPAGLQFMRTKVPLENVVIDRLDRVPTEN